MRECARQLAHAGLIQRGEVQRAAVRVAVAEQALKRVGVLQRGRLLCCQAWSSQSSCDMRRIKNLTSTYGGMQEY